MLSLIVDYKKGWVNKDLDCSDNDMVTKSVTLFIIRIS